MKEIILIKNGELVLKGLNRRTFEDIMIKNIKRKLSSLGGFDISRAQSTIVITPKDSDFDMDEATERVGTVFGISAYSRAAVCEKDMESIKEVAREYLADALNGVSTFKVEAKRSDKKFPLKSPEICMEIGGVLLEAFPHLSVDVHNPQQIVTVEIRDRDAYIRAGQLRGAGGMPVSSAGRAAIMISGGIDSPVAAYLMARRGLELNAIHFASPPYTSPRAELKVRQLLEKVARYSGTIRLGIVPFTEIQEEIAKNCPEEYFTLIMRRMMLRIAQRLAKERGCGALITGESLGQVASQTLPALAVTDTLAEMPVLRPLIGMDKEDIIAVSRKIDTFEISIQPYEDCCTVFTPKHPRTRPTIEQCEKAEGPLDIEALIERAVAATEYSYID
ncbi:MAG: tRNA 4-thiouridine(8) synthase ThiI [Ruminococcaceae bacterium]|nr:tRNA 4-thiouridine(8) synthase ThiI [Oscillospiraceae bacterium]